MPTALDELFMAESMTTAVRRFADQSQDRSWIAPYEAGERLLPTGDTVKWDEMRYSRDLAPVTGQSSPSTATKPVGVIKKFAPIVAIKEHVDLDARFMLMAKGFGAEMPNPAEVLATNLQNLTNRVLRTLNFWAAQSMLASGGSVDLSTIPNSQLTGVTLVYPVQLISSGLAWNDPASNLRSGEINTVKRTYQRASGLRVARAIASDTVEGYITGNNQVNNLVSGGGLAARLLETSFEQGGGVVNFGGIGWQFARDYYAADATPDTTADVISDADLVALLPDPSLWQQCFAMALGEAIVPSGPISALVGGNPLNLLTRQRGFVAWVELITNPIGLRLHVEWHGMMIQKVRNAVARYNTTP